MERLHRSQNEPARTTENGDKVAHLLIVQGVFVRCPAWVWYAATSSTETHREFLR